MFMKIDSVQGESTDNTYSKQIEISGWNWGATQTGTSGSATGSSAGKASVQDLTYTATVDRSVPTLLKMLLVGTHFNTATLTVCKATGGTPLAYLVVTMTNGIISAVNFSGTPGDELHTVTVSLNFSQVSVQYTPQNSDGQALPAVQIGYNIAQAISS